MKERSRTDDGAHTHQLLEERDLSEGREWNPFLFIVQADPLQRDNLTRLAVLRVNNGSVQTQ